MKTSRKQVIIILTFVFNLLCFAGNSFAAKPVLFFSDMTDGPTSGFNGSSSTGAAITIWGNGFGNSRGSSTLTVGGVTLNTDASFAEWGATTNPTTARGLQRITFYLNSSMATGGTAPNTIIKVTVGGIDSNTIPFHCRALGSNHIYFLSPTGSDSANGTSTSTPWQTGAKIRATLVAGDIVYLRGGIYLDVDPYYSISRAAWIEVYQHNLADGAQYNSIGIISYPGEMAQIGNGEPYANSYPFPDEMFDRMSTSGGSAWNYWTISKIKALIGTGVLNEGSSNNNSDIGLRFVGMDIRTTSTGAGIGIPFTKEGSGGGCSKFYLLGNYFHHTGVPNPPVNAPTISTGSGSGLTGLYNAKYTYVSYNNGATGSLMQESEMSPAGTAVNLSNGALRITWSPPSASRQASTRPFYLVRIYRTKAGGSTYYFDQEVAIANGYVDSTTADSSLSARSTIEGGYYVGPMYFGGYGHLNDIYVMYNEMFHCNGTAIQNYGHCDFDTMDNSHFAYNYVHEMGTCAWNSRPAAIFGGGDTATCGTHTNYQYLKHMYIYNNVFSNNYGSQLRIDNGSPGGYLGGGHVYVFNNTFYNDVAYGTTMGGTFNIGGNPDSTVQFTNNIVYSLGVNYYNHPGGSSKDIANSKGLSADHNIFYGLGANHGLSVGAEPYPWSGPATGDLYNTVPPFSASNPSSFAGFSLSGSSADVGTTSLGVAIRKDIVGTLRKTTPSSPSIGAYEYDDGSASPLAPVLH